MTPEDRLRQAITNRTSRVEPSTDALNRIEEKLMDAQRSTNRNRLLLGIGATAAAVAVVVGVIALNDDDQPVDTVAPTTTTAPPDDTTTTTVETTTTVFVPAVDPSVPVWPPAHTSQRFDDPEAAVRSFALDFVGMTHPVVGAFQQGDSRSGEVPLRARADGQVSTVLVRQLEDNTWFVIGSTTEDVRLDTPTALADIDCPVRLTGEALAFEGTVQVSIRDDYSEDGIGRGFVTGGGGPSAPFDDEVDCDLDLLDDGVHFGSIVLTTESGEDGSPWTVVVVRVALK